MENLTDCISINHNWCNAANLPALYAAMCEEVERVEQALEDVRDMLVTAHKAKAEEGDSDSEAGWKREFVKIVQDVTQADAGWKCVPILMPHVHAIR